MKSEDIDKLFKEKLTQIDAKPSDKVWQGIERKLTKKKRRVVPFWWFSGAAAVVLLLSIFLYQPTTNEDKKDNNPIIITDKPSKPVIKHQKTVKDTVLKTAPNNDAIYIANKKEKQQKKPIKTTSTKLKDKIAIHKNNGVFKKDFNDAETNKKSDNNSKTNSLKKADSLKKSSISEIQKSKKDFIATIEEDKKDHLKETKKTIKNKWSVSTVVAVLNANSFSDSSPIDANLAKSTVGTNSFSYGVKVAFKINNKWSIQSGIHQQKMAYQNTDIAVLNSPASSMSSAVFSANNSFNFNNNKNIDAFSTLDIYTLNTFANNGDLFQEIGYIEIPLEVKYQLFNKNKFQTSIITGFSSLFLNTNSINLVTNTVNLSGNANNLNNVNFSGNFGADFSYFLNKNWSININPMFKVQLNTFNQNANGFTPFNIGIYTGINYQF